MVSARFQEYALKKYAEREDFYAPLREEIENGLSGCTCLLYTSPSPRD